MLGATNRLDSLTRDWSQANLTTMTSADKPLNENKVVLQVSGQSEVNEVNKEKLFEEIEKLNEQMKATNKSLRFKYSEEAEKFYVQIIDARSQEVIESIPSEYMIELSAKLKDLVGLFFDKRL